MIEFSREVLDNGLTVILHRDTSTPMAVVNMLYKTGSRDENPENTGTAHLLEHLMFGESDFVKHLDTEVQKAGGEINAYTNNDITNYYTTLPASNIETGLWIESGRLSGIKLTNESVRIQKNVVIEEYKQRYLNQPYGDIWLLIRPMAYHVHPYRWPTIGKEITHIENHTTDYLNSYYKKWYSPKNAILSIAGNIDIPKTRNLVKKWFSNIEPGVLAEKNLPSEPPQTEHRQLIVEREVPYSEIYLSFHMAARNSKLYQVDDLISDLLASGKSSALYKNLIMKNRGFTEINAFVTGDIDPGLFIIQGRLSEKLNTKEAFEILMHEIDLLSKILPLEDELQKVKNKIEANRQYALTDNLNKASELAYYEILGDPGLINKETELYSRITPEIVHSRLKQLFRPENCSSLFYNALQK